MGCPTPALILFIACNDAILASIDDGSYVSWRRVWLFMVAFCGDFSLAFMAQFILEMHRLSNYPVSLHTIKNMS